MQFYSIAAQTDRYSRIAPILFQTFLFALTIAALRERIKVQFIGRSIIDLFVRDGMWAFSIIFGEFANHFRGLHTG